MKLFLLFVLTGFAFAQDLPCAALLDNLPSSSLQGVSTLEATLSIRYVENGGNEVQYALAKDFENERTYHSYREKMGEDFVTAAIYRYQDGSGTLTRGDKTEEAPSEDSIVGIGEMMELLEFDLQNVFAAGGVESCDGQQTYGDVVTGEQVTENSNGEKTSFVFDEAGQLLGLRFYYEDTKGIPLSTFTDFVVKDGLLQSGIVRYYKLKRDEAVLLEERVLEVQSYNQPLDESLFTSTE
jgi:hypothetical protein